MNHIVRHEDIVINLKRLQVGGANLQRQQYDIWRVFLYTPSSVETWPIEFMNEGAEERARTFYTKVCQFIESDI